MISSDNPKIANPKTINVSNSGETVFFVSYTVFNGLNYTVVSVNI